MRRHSGGVDQFSVLSFICELSVLAGSFLKIGLLICSVTVCRFSNSGDDWYVLVGVAKDLILNPRSVAGGLVYTYKLINNGEKLEFVHKVCTDEYERGSICLVGGSSD